MSNIVLSSHVLDTASGKPAVGLFVELYKRKDNNWLLWHNTMTNSDGRIRFPFTEDSMGAGIYKLHFNVGDYFQGMDKETFYPYVEIVFKIKQGEHYHVPLLLSPFGYSTYRGS
ncbi:hypothetical protein evm_013304 [Chilo suppressalis]|nr:hypothetical protein evm_013304 [Chilo suppressalis]